MKILYFILALYVLVISIRPCCADDNCTDNDQSAKTEQSKDNQHDNDCKGSCSPFYNCGTCSGFSIPTISFSLTPSAIPLTNQVSIYNPSFTSEFFQSIWQPPKIS